ncbi:hypothetical protein [Mesorhizobium delmotii]|uniref:hypothetical protein n=1 Tax=Mesorhizobium delmotii TaxID=1631247 RepID=UPI0014036A0E|nr:hypothetical protein [Mesorhizobium delmotii]
MVIKPPPPAIESTKPAAKAATPRMTTVWVARSNIGWLREGLLASGKMWCVRTTADPFAQGRFRATYAKRAATRLALLFYACRYLKTAAHF